MWRHSLQSCLKWKAGGVCTSGREHRVVYISMHSTKIQSLMASAAAEGLSISPCWSRGPTRSRGDWDSRGRRCWVRFQAPPPPRCCLRCSQWAPESSAHPPPSRKWWGCCRTTEQNLFKQLLATMKDKYPQTCENQPMEIATDLIQNAGVQNYIYYIAGQLWPLNWISPMSQ